MGSVSLKVDNVNLSYGKFSISRISFSLQAGDILGLVGRSGSGKSTIIKALTGSMNLDKGSITANDGNKAVPLVDIIGYSPQENSLYPFLTLEENIITFGKLYGMTTEHINQNMDFVLRRLDLRKYRNLRVNKFSGGMQKRADLAVTLIHAPQVIILDEPFNGLDISLQKFIWNLLIELSKEGKIIIISSHILGDIQKNCNQFGLVEKGAFYNTSQVVSTLKRTKEKSLELYLERLFTQDLITEK